MAFFQNLTLTSVSPSQVEDAGGDEIVITGQFLDSDAQVFVVVSGQDVPCYSGASGQGSRPRPVNPTTLRAVVPPLDIGGPYQLKVVQGSQTAYLDLAVTTVARNWGTRVFRLRRVFPQWYATGPRDLGTVDLLVPGSPNLGHSIDPIADQQPVLSQAFSFTPTVNNPDGDPLTWSSVGTPLPGWASLNASTGEITGTPGISDLLTANGVTSGIILEATDGQNISQSNAFSISVQGVALPTPIMNFSLDTADVSGTTVTEKVSANNGTLVGNPMTGVSAVVGEGVAFDGVDDKISIPHQAALDIDINTDAATIVAWVSTTETGGAPILGKRDQPSFFAGHQLSLSVGELTIQFYDGVGINVKRAKSDAGTLNDGAAYHVGWTHNGNGLISGMNFYVGGIQTGVITASDTGPLGATTNTEDAAIGSSGGLSASAEQLGSFNFVDELAMWKVELTPDQMATVTWLGSTGQSLQSWIGF